MWLCQAHRQAVTLSSVIAKHAGGPDTATLTCGEKILLLFLATGLGSEILHLVKLCTNFTKCRIHGECRHSQQILQMEAAVTSRCVKDFSPSPWHTVSKYALVHNTAQLRNNQNAMSLFFCS